MSRIRILPESVANKIAAGEVVERPASVVKELVENALDAGARFVRVEAEAGGKRMIRVIDDGCGMTNDDALLAFERHATSKLRSEDDLLSIATLGFRGEALPSVAAVSRLLLETRTAEEPQGTRVEFAGGKLVGVKPAGLPVGTSVSVADIFYCVPARRKFLKSETTELSHIASLVTHYALAHPDKQFQLRTPSQEIASVAPVATLEERVYQLFGRQALDELLEIPPTSSAVRETISEPEIAPGEHRAKLSVTGLTSRPEVQRPNRNGIFIFVNRRLVRDRLILHAIHEAYRNITPPNSFPVVLLFLELPYEEVDVNVHPSKIEVRFRHPRFVHDVTRESIRAALVNARPIATFSSATANLQTRVAVGTEVRPAAGGMAAAAAAASADRGVVGAGSPRPAIPDAVSLDGGAGADNFELTGAPLGPEPQRFRFETGTLELSAGRPPEAGSFGVHSEPEGIPAGGPGAEGILDIRPLGQLNASFIVAVNSQGLWLVDQHVAHERILFEQHLRARRQGALSGQRLLVPLVTELSPRQLVIFERIAEELRQNGFEIEPMGPRSVAIQAAPAGIWSADAERLLTEILDGVEREVAAISMDSLQAKIAASTACHAAIKVNMPLDQAKMQWLLAELARTECPMSCPHGRPVVLRYSVREIERAFKRI